MNDMGDVFEDTVLEIDDAETSSTIVTDADKIQPQSNSPAKPSGWHCEETVVEIDKAETFSTIVTDADKVKPKAMSRDPEHISEVKLINEEQLRKMPDDYISRSYSHMLQ
ncbi:unnamed protein product [Caenorhabditis nigoni]